MLTLTTLCLALNIYYETRGTGSYSEQMGVTNVVFNRVEHHKFPDSECGVITQPNQFSWYWKDREFFPVKETNSWLEAVTVATLMVLYDYKDNTDGSLFYHVYKKEECKHEGKVMYAHIYSKEWHH